MHRQIYNATRTRVFGRTIVVSAVFTFSSSFFVSCQMMNCCRFRAQFQSNKKREKTILVMYRIFNSIQTGDNSETENFADSINVWINSAGFHAHDCLSSKTNQQKENESTHAKLGKRADKSLDSTINLCHDMKRKRYTFCSFVTNQVSCRNRSPWKWVDRIKLYFKFWLFRFNFGHSNVFTFWWAAELNFEMWKERVECFFFVWHVVSVEP